MAKLIIVRGISRTGKTTSIIRAMNRLGIYIGNGPQDVLVIADLYLTGAYVKIGFASGGDMPKIIQFNINFFQSHSPEIMIFASRTMGDGPTLLDNYAKQLGVEAIFIDTQKSPLADPANIEALIEKNTKEILAKIP